MKTLLHSCCAPCSIGCIEALRKEGVEPVGFWYNPNIHPLLEYRARRDALIAYAERIGMEMIVEDEYGLREFVAAVAADIDRRCGHCYAARADRTAAYAAGHGFDSFTTTLLISPYQDHEALKAAMRAAGERHGVEFLERDFRPLFREGQRRARELELYMQKYCGCVFSEEERYAGRKR